MKDAKIDTTDLKILNSLFQNGRKSFRQISREINVSTPTVESRYERLRKVGIIKNIEPIIDLGKLENIHMNIMYIKTDPNRSNSIATEIASISEITNLYAASGDHNLVAMVITRDQTHFEQVRQQIASIHGIASLTYQSLNKVIKDKMNIPLEKEVKILINCPECGSYIHSFSHKILNTDFSYKYFCCKSCMKLYKQKPTKT